MYMQLYDILTSTQEGARVDDVAILALLVEAHGRGGAGHILTLLTVVGTLWQKWHIVYYFPIFFVFYQVIVKTPVVYE